MSNEYLEYVSLPTWAHVMIHVDWCIVSGNDEWMHELDDEY